MPETKPLVLYHGGCRDGFTAAWCAWLALGDEAEYRPAFYGTPPPADIDGRGVYILDSSFKRPEMLDVIRRAARTTVIDHHESAQELLAELSQAALEVGRRPPMCFDAIFDKEHSGGWLAWSFFCRVAPITDRPGGPFWTEAPVPPIVAYAQDRDLWTWALPLSREVSAWISSLPFEFGAWDEANRLMESAVIEHVAAMGSAVASKMRSYCREVGSNARSLLLPYDASGIPLIVPCINAPQCDVSDLLEYLMDSLGSPQAIAWWHRKDGLVQVSVRSRAEGKPAIVPARKIAEFYGGGGHHDAAGFQIPLAEWVAILSK